MLFGLSLTKLMVVVAIGVLFFAVPLMSFLITIKERHARKSRKRGADSWRR
ncbi:MAG: hypothetical protein O7J95_00205 [Planctomycetota bacterium]|nr:hypothetical protein [Planctomycetota bacterium]